MKRRQGHTYLILDGKRLTLAFGGAYFTDGSHRPFRVEAYWRGRGDNRRLGITIPTLPWRLCWRFRGIGGVTWYAAQGRVLHRLFCTRH